MRPVTVTLPPDNVRIIGIIHFVHGMQEHRKRYGHVLDYFSKRGYICAITDLKGHGENITKPEELGYFSPAGADALVDDVASFNEYLKKTYPGLPVILVGHSMGSLIVRDYVKTRSGEINALIVTGSPSYNVLARPGRALIRLMALFKGWKYKSPLITGLIVGSFDKPFSKEGQKNAWLTRDGDVVDAFNRDPLCGQPFTLNGYKALLTLMIRVYSKEGWKNVQKDLPVMFLSGGDDPCRINDKKWKDSVNSLKDAGFHKIYSKMYPGMRHEIFNETGKEEVFEDILKFLELNLNMDHETDL